MTIYISVVIMYKSVIMIIGLAFVPYTSFMLYRKTREEYIKNRANYIHDIMSNIDTDEREQFYNDAIQDWKLTNQTPEDSICRTYDNRV